MKRECRTTFEGDPCGVTPHAVCKDLLYDTERERVGEGRGGGYFEIYFETDCFEVWKIANLKFFSKLNEKKTGM